MREALAYLKMRWLQNRDSRVFRYRSGVRALEAAFHLWRGKRTELERARAVLAEENGTRICSRALEGLDTSARELLTKRSFLLLRMKIART